MQMLHLYSKSCPIAQSSTPACTQTSTRKETLSVATGGASSDRRHVNLTYCAWHHALSWHQVVIEALQATVQGVGDSPLVVVQGGVRSLRSERTPWCLLDEEGGDVRIIPAFTQSQFCCCTFIISISTHVVTVTAQSKLIKYPRSIQKHQADIAAVLLILNKHQRMRQKGTGHANICVTVMDGHRNSYPC